MTMNSSFSSVGFTVLYAGLGHSVKSEVTWMHIPGGNVNVGDMAGRLEQRFSLSLFCEIEAYYWALVALVGTVGSLRTIDGVFDNAYLIDVTRTQRTPDGGTFAQAEFVLSETT